MNHLNIHILCRNSLVFLTLTLLAQGCEKDPEPLTTNSVIRGSVFVSDYETVESIKVIARGPYGDKSVFTKAGDNFLIDGLGNGTYCVEYIKEGYGTTEQCGLQLFGNDTVYGGVTLYKNPGPFKVPSLIRAYIGYPIEPDLPFICIETDAKQEVYLQIQLFLKSGSDVAWNKYNTYINILYSAFDYEKDMWIIYLPLNYEDRSPFQTGQKVYIKAYAFNLLDRGYVDAYLGLRVFSSLDKSRSSNVVDVIMP